ncbi:hypothetical protein Desaci_4268 [Desulfosporosinus acidiphilus SJ4]|uniref:Uncharacterized protein n=1 Tax=Desulfosporosinus acidiphilus (strain DSM 22704 / JCM 16185 / SJ4) TaxID=646529 RepID=I4DBE6_DESAJ|nr:hypothetical protein [Desulfosporosinus acidiphilus]AFM43120.1 hypothetical protein Desaci_4268 [Desulfosporosinus acidiphilus SJ4]
MLNDVLLIILIVIILVMIIVLISITFVQPKIVSYLKERNYEIAYRNSIKLINQQEWSEAAEILDNLAHSSPKGYKNSFILWCYAYAKDIKTKNPHSTITLNFLPSDYNGEFVEDIKVYATKLEREKVELQKENLAHLTTSFPEPPSEPKIGMTSDQVLESSWGKPTKVNQTTTAYSVREKWIYDSGRTVYLSNGKVIVIQDEF